MLATSLTGRKENSAGAHSESLRLALQQPLVFGIIIQVYNKNRI
jgi:hypothetical protein